MDQLLSAYRDKRERDKAMLEQMVFYGQTGLCRWKVLQGHFGEDEGFERCNTCDNCLRMAMAQASSLPVAAGTSENPPLHEAEPPAQPMFNIDDIRHMFENDVRFLEQFK